MNDPLYSRLRLPEPCQIALYEIDEALSFVQAQRNNLCVQSPGMPGLTAFNDALDTMEMAFQAFIEQQEVEGKS